MSACVCVFVCDRQWWEFVNSLQNARFAIALQKKMNANVQALKVAFNDFQ